MLYVLVACGCYDPSPASGLACSETGHCPSGQSCDPAFHECAAFPLCRPAAIADSFDAGLEPCKPWGMQFGNATLDEQGGALTITPRADGQNTGGCTADRAIDFGDGGIFLEVPQAMPSGHGFVGMAAQGETPPPSIIARDSILELSIPGTTVATLPYDPAAMRWWRLRPDRRADTTVAEYAADGAHWKPLGVLDAPPAPQITIELVGGVETVDPAPTTARLTHLNVCPPRS